MSVIAEYYIKRFLRESGGKGLIYSVDFDNTLCEDAWPNIGEPNYEVIEYCIALRACGNRLILNTCREGELLEKARRWCAGFGLVFDAYNENLPERIEKYGGDCRKISADIYIEDKAIRPEELNTWREQNDKRSDINQSGFVLM